MSAGTRIASNAYLQPWMPVHGLAKRSLRPSQGIGSTSFDRSGPTGVLLIMSCRCAVTSGGGLVASHATVADSNSRNMVGDVVQASVALCFVALAEVATDPVCVRVQALKNILSSFHVYILYLSLPISLPPLLLSPPCPISHHSLSLCLTVFLCSYVPLSSMVSTTNSLPFLVFLSSLCLYAPLLSLISLVPLSYISYGIY